MALYKFERLSRKMDEWGYPRIDTASGFRVVQKDFEEAFRAGEIRFEDDGIYLDYEGKSYKGYMFIREYHITKYTTQPRFPKFHVMKCDVIEEFIASGKFKQRYQFSNSATNDIVDIDTDEEYPDQTLTLCKRCSSMIVEEYYDTESFHEQIRGDANEAEEKVEVDIFGYDRHWQQISRAYKRKKNYTCEECGLEITNRFDRRFLHVHHINGNKVNNEDYNLKCLCIQCHSRADAGHQRNFGNRRNRALVKAFKSKYRV